MANTVSRRELIRKLRNMGFSGPFSGGRHQFMQRESLKLRIPNPHLGDIHIGLIKEILRQGNIPWDDWENA